MGFSSSRKGIDNSPGPAILLGPEKKGGLNFPYRSEGEGEDFRRQ
jgi:hypothetical protein